MSERMSLVAERPEPGAARPYHFPEVLRRDGIEPYPGSVRFLDALERRGVAAHVHI